MEHLPRRTCATSPGPHYNSRHCLHLHFANDRNAAEETSGGPRSPRVWAGRRARAAEPCGPAGPSPLGPSSGRLGLSALERRGSGSCVNSENTLFNALQSPRPPKWGTKRTVCACVCWETIYSLGCTSFRPSLCDH